MKTVILSLGGSVIVPDKVDVAFLKNFKKIIEKYTKKGYRVLALAHREIDNENLLNVKECEREIIEK
mgnify:CR=1 FL=1